jgi:hypothetical protein
VRLRLVKSRGSPRRSPQPVHALESLRDCSASAAVLLVPVLYEVFKRYGVPDDVLMPLCVGTPLAVIVPTSISSLIGYYKKGAVDLDVLKVWAHHRIA